MRSFPLGVGRKKVISPITRTGRVVGCALTALVVNFTVQQTSAKEIEDYLELLENHPKVQAIKAQHTALNHQAGGAVGLPDPTFFVGVDNVPVNDFSFDSYLPTSKVMGFSQSIPSSRGRNAQKDIFLASAESTALQAEYAVSLLHSRFYTRMAELHRIQLQIAYENEKKQIIKQLQEYYEGQVVAGEPSYQKTFMTEIERTGVEQAINALQAEKAAVEADLVQLVGEIPDLGELYHRQKDWNGEVIFLYPVKLASRNIDVAGAKVELADSKYRPNFGISGIYKIRESGENGSFEGDDWFSAQVSMTVPLWASKNQRPKLEAAKSGKRSAELGYREALLKWQMETTRLSSAQQASMMNIELLHKEYDALRMKIATMERTYSAGQTSLEPVLQAELARVSLLSQIAREKQQYISITEELNGHIITPANNE